MEHQEIFKKLAELAENMAGISATISIIVYILGGAVPILGALVGFLFKYNKTRISDIIKDGERFRQEIESRIKEVENHVYNLNVGREANLREITAIKEKIKSIIRICRLQHGKGAYLGFEENGDA